MEKQAFERTSLEKQTVKKQAAAEKCRRAHNEKEIWDHSFTQMFSTLSLNPMFVPMNHLLHSWITFCTHESPCRHLPPRLRRFLDKKPPKDVTWQTWLRKTPGEEKTTRLKFIINNKENKKILLHKTNLKDKGWKNYPLWPEKQRERHWRRRRITSFCF